MSFLEAVILGVVQGVTEFLPVSSSGHLRIAEVLIGGEQLDRIEQAFLFNVMVHVGTLVPVVIVFRREVARFIRGLFKLVRLCVRPSMLRRRFAEDEEVRLAGLIVVATIPTGLIGLAIKAFLESAIDAHPSCVAVFFLVTAAALVLSDRKRGGDRGVMDLRLTDALIVGVAQGVATLPGISRSGATICASVFLGAERSVAARFSFVLSIPAIVLAALLHVVEGLRDAPAESIESLGILATGAVVAALVGLPALLLVVRFVRRAKLGWFAVYLVPAAVAILVALKVVGSAGG